MQRRLDFAVIGAHKSASTYVSRGLRQHPQLWIPREEFPVFRDPVFDAASLDQFNTVLNVADHGRAIGIKCPDYLARSEVVPRLHTHSPAVKLIAVLRDPTARAISAYFWHVRWGLLPIEDVNVGLQKVLDGTFRLRNGNVDEIIDWGLYHRHLSEYFRMFSQEQVYIILNEEVRNDSDAVFRRLFAFLGVADFKPQVVGAETNEGVYSRQRLRFLNLRNRYVLRWDDARTYATIPKARGIVGSVVSGAVAATDRIVLSRVFDNSKPVVDEDVVQQFRRRFDDDIALLETLIGHDLTRWKSDDALA